jgi:transposase InsO family protein
MLKVDIHRIKQEIDNAGHGQKSIIVRQFANQFKVSTGTIYRMLRREYGIQKEINRDPKIPEDIIKRIALLKSRSTSLSNTWRELPTGHCIEILQRQGIHDSENLTVGTVNRRLREAGFRIPTARVRVELDFATQEYQLDFSRSKYFQLKSYDQVNDDWVLKVSGKELHYKDEDARLRTWLVQAKDSYSRLRVARAYAATGESGFLGLQFLNWVFNRDKDGNPMRHVMHILKTDNGAFAKLQESKMAMEALGVEWRMSRPYRKESNGKIESGFKSIWWKFELTLATELGHGNVLPLREYNRLLSEYMILDAQKQHPAIKDTVEAVYRKSIMSIEPRVVDEDILRLACRVERRKVKDRIVSIDNEQYETPDHANGKWILVHKNKLGEMIGRLEEENKKPFILSAWSATKYDQYFQYPHTYSQRMEAESQETIKEPLQGLAKKASRPERRLFMPERSVPVEINSPFVYSESDLEFPSVLSAKIYIGEHLRMVNATYPDYAYVFDDLLNECLYKESIDQVLEVIKQQSTTSMRIAL